MHESDNHFKLATELLAEVDDLDDLVKTLETKAGDEPGAAAVHVDRLRGVMTVVLLRAVAEGVLGLRGLIVPPAGNDQACADRPVASDVPEAAGAPALADSASAIS